MAAGRIRDPLLGLNSFDCAWTEERSGCFRRTFPTDPAWLMSDAVELQLNGLDANASIFLNGHHLGDHKSVFYPFVADIKTHLNAEGDNTLLVRLTAGVEGVTPDMPAPREHLLFALARPSSRPFWCSALPLDSTRQDICRFVLPFRQAWDGCSADL